MRARDVGLVVVWTALAACRRPEATSAAEVPQVVTSSSSPWRVTRSGLSPAFSTDEGRATVAVEPAYDEAIRRLPGVTLGSEEGTRPAVLGGLLAPHLAPAGSDRAYRVDVDARGLALDVRYSAAILAPENGRSERELAPAEAGFRVRVETSTTGRARMSATGAYVVLLPADRTEVRATTRGVPSEAFRVDADAPPSLRVVAGDRIEIRSERAGVVTIETSCARARLITPIHRGSTSVFLLALGPLPRVDDPLFSPGAAALASDAAQNDCPSTTTATLSAPWSKPAR